MTVIGLPETNPCELKSGQFAYVLTSRSKHYDTIQTMLGRGGGLLWGLISI